MATRIDKESNRSMRAFKLVFLVTAQTRGLRMSTLSRDEWGDDATIRRLIKMINAAWQEMHARPLIEIVDEHGKPTVRGDRHLRLYKPEIDRAKFHDFRATRLAAFPAVFEFLKVIQNTIIVDELMPFYRRLQEDMSRAEKKQLERLEDKFVFASRGTKPYNGTTDILDDVYDALIREVKLEIKTASAKGEKTSVVRPLGMIFYNNGLYLVAHYDTQKPDAEPYKLKLETILAATPLRDEPFKYPAGLKIKERFDGEFGIFFDARQEPIEVELEFKADDGIKRSVRERVYTKKDRYEELPDGRLVLKFAVRGLNEVTSWVLSWGANVRVRKPEALRKAVSDAARAMIELNDAS
jgi:predicted DNA-binding transcriptional regulator YafY